MKYIYLRRKSDGQVLDIPEDQVAETLKHGFERVPIVVQTDVPTVAPVVAAEGFPCPLCDKSFKTEQGRRVHKNSHK